jgi:RND family efflux transporter MFP subunit
MKTAIKYLLFTLLILGAGVFFYKKIYIPKTTYERLVVQKGALDVEVYGIGNVGANHLYKLTSQVGGKVLSIKTDEGKWVKKGELLVTIDTVDIPKLLEESEIAVRKAKSEFIASKKELPSLFAQKKLAQITYRRYDKLHKQAFVSKAEFDKVKSDLDIVNAQIASTQAHINSAEIEVERSSKAVEGLKEKLKRYQIYAPVDGYVTSRQVEVAQTLLPSQTILEIVDPHSVWVKTYIDEKISGKVKVGQNATIKLRSSLEKRFNGKVARIVSQSDAITQEREVDVVFNQLPIPFYMNEQAEVTISAEHHEGVIKVPAKALAYYQEKRGVWIEKEGKAHFVVLKIIAQGVNEVAVEGLQEEDRILLESEKNKPLKEGASIR